jgi:hypothetical protein
MEKLLTLKAGSELKWYDVIIAWLVGNIESIGSTVVNNYAFLLQAIDKEIEYIDLHLLRSDYPVYESCLNAKDHLITLFRSLEIMETRKILKPFKGVFDKIRTELASRFERYLKVTKDDEAIRSEIYAIGYSNIRMK